MDSVAFIDVRDVLKGIARRWVSIALFTALCAFASYWFVNNVDPVYTASSQVLIERQDSPFARVGQDRNELSSLSDRDITSQVEVVRSRDLALRVINDLKLSELDEFDPLKKGIGTLGSILINFGFKTDPATLSLEQRTLQSYYDGLTTYAIPQSSVLQIEFEAGDPKLAAMVANQIATYYVSFSKKTLNEPTGQARDWLQAQIEDLRKKVVDSETAVEKFRAEAGLFRGAQAKLSNEELSSLNSQIILASAAHSDAKAKADSIRELLRTTGTVDTSSDVLASPLIQRLREQQVQLTRSKAELSTIYLDNHPRIVAVNREIQDLNSQLRNEAFKVVERLEQEAKIAAAREQSLRANLNQLKKETSETGADDVRLRELEREASANRSLLETFLVRFTDASSRQDISTQPGLGRIISGAGEPAIPSFPKKGPIMLLATVGGFMIALGLAFVVEVMSSAASMSNSMTSRVANRNEALELTPAQTVTTHTTTPSFGAGVASAPPPSAVLHSPPPAQSSGMVQQTPAALFPNALTVVSAMATPMLAIHATGHGLSDASNTYRKTLEPVFSTALELSRVHKIKRLAVINLTTSPLDGMSLTLALGRLLAVAGTKTVLVDASVSKPGFEVLDLQSSGKGLFDVVSGKAGFSDAIVRDRMSQLQIMTAGTFGDLTPDALSGTTMANALNAMDQVYQMCLLHLGGANDKNIGLAANSGAVLVLANEDKIKEAQEICDALKSGQVKQAYVVCVSRQTSDTSVGRFSNIAASL